MGKRKKEEKAPMQVSKVNTVEQSKYSITKDLSTIKKTKRHENTDGEIWSTGDETITENKNVAFTEDLKEKKRKKKHTHVDNRETDHKIETKGLDSASSSVMVHPSPEESLLDDYKSKVKKNKAKKKRQINKEDITLACEDVGDDPENDTSVDNLNVTKDEVEESEKRREEKKQRKKDKKLKKELEKQKGSVTEKDDEKPVGPEKKGEEKKQRKKDKKLEKGLEKQKGSGTEKDEEKPVGPSIAQLALEYLNQWNTERQQWKFQKVRQVWLLQNIYHGDKIGAEHFKVLLLYLEGMKGKSREITAKQAEDILAVNENPSETTTVAEVTEVKLDRAKQIIQVLAQ